MESMSSIQVLLIFIIFILLFGYTYLTWNFNYWTNRDVIGPKPKLWFGTYPNIINQKYNLIYNFTELYNKYKETEKFVGIFQIRDPYLLIISPDIVHEILVTKFKYFRDNGVSEWVNKKSDEVVARNPAMLTGDAWKEKRFDLLPALTTSRVKGSYPIMLNGCNKLIKYISNLISESSEPIEAKKICNLLTAEIVCNYAYGLEAAAFASGENFVYKYAQEMVASFISGYQIHLISSILPFIKNIFKIRFLSYESEEFFTKCFLDGTKIRQSLGTERSDLLNYVLQIKKKKDRVSQVDMVAYTTTFFFDAYETTASVISHCLLLLARHKPSQERLREEIMNNLNEDGILDYEKLLKLEYLDNCCNETIRLFPPVLFSSKVCTEQVELENTRGRKICLKPGDKIQIPFYAIHHDENIYPNPEEFIPDRFNDVDAKVLKNEGKFLAFGDGPRICPGMKFGIALTKITICEIVRNFALKIHGKTRKDNLVEPVGPLGIFHGGIWLNLERIYS